MDALLALEGNNTLIKRDLCMKLLDRKPSARDSVIPQTYGKSARCQETQK